MFHSTFLPLRSEITFTEYDALEFPDHVNGMIESFACATENSRDPGLVRPALKASSSTR